MTVLQAIVAAEQILPGTPPAPDANNADLDARWQAVITVGNFVESNPEEVWAFAAKWATIGDADLRMAVATCVLEHLLEHHFVLLFPRVEELVRTEHMFADTFRSCWQFGQAETEKNTQQFDSLREQAKLLWEDKRR